MRLDLPAPDTPVTAHSTPSGNRTSTFLRLFSRAPRTSIHPAGGRRASGTVRTYRAHHLGPDPLLEPGSTDITMDVDFSALAAVVEECGATVEYSSQADFLTRWGLRDRLTDLRHRELEAARGSDTMERLMFRSRVTEAETLLHPRGLGDFRVLVARKSLPAARFPLSA